MVSKHINIIIISSGIIDINTLVIVKYVGYNNLWIATAKVSNNICPATIFANSLSAKLILLNI